MVLFIVQFILNFEINRKLSALNASAAVPSFLNFILSCYRPKWSVQLSADWLLRKAYSDMEGDGDYTRFESTDVALGMNDSGIVRISMSV